MTLKHLVRLLLDILDSDKEKLDQYSEMSELLNNQRFYFERNEVRSKYPESNLEEGSRCMNCRAKKIRNLRIVKDNKDTDVIICTTCLTKLEALSKQDCFKLDDNLMKIINSKAL